MILPISPLPFMHLLAFFGWVLSIGNRTCCGSWDSCQIQGRLQGHAGEAMAGRPQDKGQISGILFIAQVGLCCRREMLRPIKKLLRAFGYEEIRDAPWTIQPSRRPQDCRKHQTWSAIHRSSRPRLIFIQASAGQDHLPYVAHECVPCSFWIRESRSKK